MKVEDDIQNKQIKLLIFIFALFMSFVFYGQGEASNWYFGNNAGVQFANGSVKAVSDGKLRTNEGCATISNSKGELLFYTDGVSVWDKNHNVMPNGTNLLGNISSTQSSIIVPKPNSDTIYFIFTVTTGGGPSGLSYSEVDLTLNNGNGDVNSNKNILLTTPCTEKISAVQHANGVDFWVATHAWNSSDFILFKVTASGIDPTSLNITIGSNHSGDVNNAIGYMKFSPNGKKLALARFGIDSLVEIFDFDSNTGIISNPITLDSFFGAELLKGAYGLEFSPNSNSLYVVNLDMKNYESDVYQFDLSIYTKVEILNSNSIVYHLNNVIGALQLAPDGKLYACNGFSSYLDVIQDPNVIGVACNYVSKGISLDGKQVVFGLPTFIQSYFVAKIGTDNLCAGSGNQFYIETDEPINNVFWDFGDGKTDNLKKPTHTYAAPGTYMVQAKINTGFSTIIVKKEVVIYESPIANKTTDYMVCNDVANDGIETFDLKIKTPEILGLQVSTAFEVSYFESYEDASNYKNALPDTYTNKKNNQEIYVRISNRLHADCYDVSSFSLIVGMPMAGSVADLILCDDPSNDGKMLVDLSQFDASVYNGIFQEDVKVTYHLSQKEADLGTAVLPISFETTSNNQEMYARLENKTTGCFTTTDFKIIVNETLTAHQPANMYLCGDGSKDGKAFFDLQVQTLQILQTQTGKVSYHITQSDADAGINAINENFENQSNPQQLFAKVESQINVSCYGTTSFYVEVTTEPFIDILDIWYLCPGEEVRLYVNSIHDEYLWSTGETSSEIVVDKAGDYTVTVYNINNKDHKTLCNTSKTIKVLEPDLPKTINIETNEWTDNNNSVLIVVEGTGDYEFSIDGVTYQRSAFFDDLLPGDYTVYVKDTNNCVFYSEAIYLLNYPKFFTPNNDGYHDYWNIEFSNTEPDIEIFIFDRYGKLIIQLNPFSNGWDGTFNGTQLSTSDYWFLVNRPSKNKQYRGHFTLKR